MASPMRNGAAAMPAGDGRPSRESGFTLTELIFWVAVSIAVLAAGVASYLGTTRSWQGTAGLARIQRESCLAMETMARGIRQGTRVEIEHGDSLNVHYTVGSQDSVIAIYYLDDDHRLLDGSGTVLVTDVDSLAFTSGDGQTANVDIFLRDDMGTPDRVSDDQTVLMSSTVVCRN